ncbi:MAG: hypothetical protein JXA30_02510 [Deltaproteobacteria bacterium]|nr:hypothetical protein [Deltaproteobacteria bacterium]
MDEIVLNVEDVRLPAKTSSNVLDDCKQCVLQRCSEQLIECYKNKGCNSLLEIKKNAGDPLELFENTSYDEIDYEAKSKYQDYFQCVFVYPSTDKEISSYESSRPIKIDGCRDECKDINVVYCEYSSDSDEDKDDIELSINILQIKDMLFTRDMASPGEHCVCVQWVETGYNPFPCTDEERTNCQEGKLFSTSKETKAYTDGFGKAIIYPRRESDGYLQIERGQYNELGELTFDDLGPVIYYIGRTLTINQEVTLYIPQRVQEENWAKKYKDKEFWSFRNGSMITALAYDCLGIPDKDIFFELNEDTHDKAYWNQIKGNKLLEFSENSNDDWVQGVSSFIIDGSFFEEDDTRTVDLFWINEEANMSGSEDSIIIKKNYSTFVAVYPEESK